MLCIKIKVWCLEKMSAFSVLIAELVYLRILELFIACLKGVVNALNYTKIFWIVYSHVNI